MACQGFCDYSDAGFTAVLFIEFPIGNDGIKSMSCNVTECLLNRTSSLKYPLTINLFLEFPPAMDSCQPSLHGFCHVLVVIDQENARRVVHGLSVSFVGRMISKEAPIPGDPFSATLPPCASTTSFTIARPRPVPSVLPDSNASNSFVFSSRRTPGPLSRKRMRIFVAGAKVPNCTLGSSCASIRITNDWWLAALMELESNSLNTSASFVSSAISAKRGSSSTCRVHGTSFT